MIYSEGCTVRYSNWEIGEHGEESIRERSLKGEIVGDFMDGEKEVLVCGGSDDVGCCYERQGEDWRVPQEHCASDL